MDNHDPQQQQQQQQQLEMRIAATDVGPVEICENQQAVYMTPVLYTPTVSNFHGQQAKQRPQIVEMISSIEQDDDNAISPVPMATEQMDDNIDSHQLDQQNEMTHHLLILHRRTQNTDSMVQSCRDKYQNLVIHYQTRSSLLANMSYAECSTPTVGPDFNVDHLSIDIKTLETRINQLTIELTQTRNELIKAHCDIFDQLLERENRILYEYLPKWHQEQQLMSNGIKVSTIKLDTIQLWVEKVVEIIWRIKNQVKGLQLTLSDQPSVPMETYELDRFVVRVNKALENLILSSFVVEKQPPQVMKTNTRFTATVRFLCGSKLNVQMINPTVKALILSEKDARTVISYHKHVVDQSWASLDSYGQPQPASASLGPGPFTPVHSQSQGCLTEIGYNPNVPMNSNDYKSSGEILNNKTILEFQEQSGHMVCQFRNMQLKKIKRAEKKGTESVMDEKFILLFFTEFRLADDSCWPYSQQTSSANCVKSLLFHTLAFSLPVVVIVHGNQEPHAWATVTWHNAFACADELLYQVPDKVPWRNLGHVLSEKFRSCAGRGLSSQNLRYLAGKISRSRVDNDDIFVSWNQFAKETLADKSFTFWEWFHSILKLTREHLRDLWRDERIWGFIGKNGCVELLSVSNSNEPVPVGTFLVRYSESELGSMTIVWVCQSSEPGSSRSPSLQDKVQPSKRMSPTKGQLATNSSPNVVMHLAPYSASDLKTRPLADRIRDLNHLVYLYPNIPKDEAFEAYYSPITSVINYEAYVESMLVTTIAAHYTASVDTNRSTTMTSPTNSANHSAVQMSDSKIYSENNASDPNYSSYDQAAEWPGG